MGAGERDQKERFVGKTIPLILAAFGASFAGVLSVDLFIEHRQELAATHVLEHTMESTLVATELFYAVDRFRRAPPVDVDVPRSVLSRARQRFADATVTFEEHLNGADLGTWRRARGALFEQLDAITTDPDANRSDAQFEQRVERSSAELHTMSEILRRRSLEALRTSQRQHRLEGALEAAVLLLMALVSVTLLLAWRRREVSARRRDAHVEAQLRRALADLDAFAGRVAHDLRSPLTPILSGSQSIERAGVDAGVRHQAERIERSARRIGRIIDGLLQFTRAGAIAAPEGGCLVAPIVADVVGDLRELSDARGARIETAIDADATVACAPEIVRSVLQNLIENALKYGHVEGAPPLVHVRARVAGECTVLEVEDRGPGVPGELRDQVFVPLFRGRASGDGVGLGLSLVKRLAEVHGGRVEIASGNQGGALFRVVLPVGDVARAREHFAERESAVH